jgi:hypothetical protein
MKKDEIITKLREYVIKKLSPTEGERKLITMIYDSFQSLLNQNCFQTGSYPRFTSIRPIHDLDIVFVIGNWDEKNHDPLETLKLLQLKIQTEYKNPTKYQYEVSLCTHSIDVIYKENNEEIFSVDIVPGYIFSKNEFNDDTYQVPEVLNFHHGKTRLDFYQRLSFEHKDMNWIVSDPKGYIEIAKKVNQQNNDFRKSVKFIKAWKKSCETKDSNFLLKSFHIEQIVTKYFQENSNLNIFDCIFKFFVDLPKHVISPQIKDRANNDKFIDDYVSNLTNGQKEQITRARDCFLKKLEEILPNDLVDNLIDGCFYSRNSISEQFLFDFGIPIFINDDYSFKIIGEVQERDGFRKSYLNSTGLITIDRKIRFMVQGNQPRVNYFKWKVKNDNSSKEPRGEITDNRTRNDPENTKYHGNHYVECYAILNNTCVAKALQNVKLEYP